MGNKTCICSSLVSVSPAGKIVIPSLDTAVTYVEAKCTAKDDGTLPEWRFNPALNLSSPSCTNSVVCPVEVGKLPLPAVREETVAFYLHEDVFGDTLKSFGSGALGIGDKLLVYCSHQGAQFYLCCCQTSINIFRKCF